MTVCLSKPIVCFNQSDAVCSIFAYLESESLEKIVEGL